MAISNLTGLMSGEKIKNEFETKVVGDTVQLIESNVQLLIDWILEKNAKQWTQVVEYAQRQIGVRKKFCREKKNKKKQKKRKTKKCKQKNKQNTSKIQTEANQNTHTHTHRHHKPTNEQKQMKTSNKLQGLVDNSAVLTRQKITKNRTTKFCEQKKKKKKKKNPAIFCCEFLWVHNFPWNEKCRSREFQFVFFSITNNFPLRNKKKKAPQIFF